MPELTPRPDDEPAAPPGPSPKKVWLSCDGPPEARHAPIDFEWTFYVYPDEEVPTLDQAGVQRICPLCHGLKSATSSRRYADELAFQAGMIGSDAKPEGLLGAAESPAFDRRDPRLKVLTCRTPAHWEAIRFWILPEWAGDGAQVSDLCPLCDVRRQTRAATRRYSTARYLLDD